MVKRALFAAAIALACSSVLATEGGGSTYPRGVENYMVGAAPPPGLHWLGYGNIYSASDLRDNRGDKIPVPGFKVRAAAAVLRSVWSTKVQLLGGNLVWHGIFPLVDLKVEAAGMSQHKTGLGDITIGPGIATHYSPQLHSVLGVDFVLPTGRYDRNDLANIGRNYVSIQPLYTVSYVDPAGFNGDFKLTLNLNRTNGDTDFKSGNELFVDYSAGWGLGGGWVLGIGGHVWQQLSNDRQAGASIVDSKVRALSVGPSVKYDNGKGWFITAKLQRESSVRNSTQGTAFWVKSTIAF
jgi:hypothetical protein